MSRSFQRCLCTRNWWPFCRKVRVVPKKRTVFQQHRSAMLFERRGGRPSCRWSTHWEISNLWWNRLQSKICWGNLGWDTVRTSRNHTSLIAVFYIYRNLVLLLRQHPDWGVQGPKFVLNIVNDQSLCYRVSFNWCPPKSSKRQITVNSIKKVLCVRIYLPKKTCDF